LNGGQDEDGSKPLSPANSGAVAQNETLQRVPATIQSAAENVQPSTAPAGASGIVIPQALLASGIFPIVPLVRYSTNNLAVGNDDLKHLMTSWYYAGYYTGLFEGKQQGYAMAQEQQQGS
jgi:hypothetical protein